MNEAKPVQIFRELKLSATSRLLGLFILGALVIVAAIWLGSKRQVGKPLGPHPSEIISTSVDDALPLSSSSMACPNDNWNKGERT